MRFTRKKGDTTTIRKVWNDEKTVAYGLIGTVEDFIEANILSVCGGKWAFITRDGATVITKDTKEELLKHIG